MFFIFKKLHVNSINFQQYMLFTLRPLYTLIVAVSVLRTQGAVSLKKNNHINEGASNADY